MGTAFNIHIALVLAGLLILTVGYASRRHRAGPVLMATGIATLLGGIAYYVATVLG